MTIGNISNLNQINAIKKEPVSWLGKRTLLIPLALALLNLNALAWECNEESIPVAYLHSDLVFEGVVYDISELSPGEFYADFRIIRSFKGNIGDSVRVSLGWMNHSYAQNVPLGAPWIDPKDEIDKTYLIYASKEVRRGAEIFQSKFCGRTLRVSKKSQEQFDEEICRLSTLINNDIISSLWFNASDLSAEEKPKPLLNVDSVLTSYAFRPDTSDTGLSIIEIVLNRDGEVLSCKIRRGPFMKVHQGYKLDLSLTMEDNVPQDRFESFALKVSRQIKTWIPARSGSTQLNTVLMLQWYWDADNRKVSYSVL